MKVFEVFDLFPVDRAVVNEEIKMFVYTATTQAEQQVILVDIGRPSRVFPIISPSIRAHAPRFGWLSSPPGR
jgi:hypothetical protein